MGGKKPVKNVVHIQQSYGPVAVGDNNRLQFGDVFSGHGVSQDDAALRALRCLLLS